MNSGNSGELLKCSKCHKELQPTWQVCPSCGMKVNKMVDPSISVNDSVIKEIHHTNINEMHNTTNIYNIPETKLPTSPSNQENQPKVTEPEIGTNNHYIRRNLTLINNLFKIALPAFLILLVITFITYSNYSSKVIDPATILQIPTNPQPPGNPIIVKSIPTFRIMPLDVKGLMIFGETTNYLTLLVTPNSSTQPDMEYGIQINYRDNGVSRAQTTAIWNTGDLQSKKRLPLLISATQSEKDTHPVVAAYWDGFNISHQSSDFSAEYTFSLSTINKLTEQQLVNQQNSESQTQHQVQLSQYQQRLVEVTQQKQDIKTQQDALNAQYLQRLTDKKTQTNKILFIFVPIDALIFLSILFLTYLRIKKPFSNVK
jgi:primosomal protein N'